MATLYFTNNADSGDGSFRAVWSSAASGDVVEPDPAVFADAVVEIVLSNYLATPQAGTYVVRKGAAKRIVFNGQDSKYFFAISRADLRLTFEDVDFIRGRRAQNAPFSGSKFGSLTFRRCRFCDNFGGTCGFLRVNCSVASSVVMESCVAYGNKNSAASGQVLDVASETTTATIRGCSFGRNYAESRPDVTFEVDENATVVDSLVAQDVDFSRVGFVDLENCDFRLAPDSPYLTGATSVVAGDVDALGNSRKVGGAIGAYEGSWFVVKANESATLDEDLVVDRIELQTGAELTFEGSDRRLAARDGAIVGAATIQSSDGAYLAIPDASAADDALLMGVVACEYGAGLLTFGVATSGSTAALTWTATDATRAVLLEKKVDGVWTSLGLVSGESELIAPVSGGANYYRAYDGERFLYCDAWSPLGVQYRVAAIWTPAERVAQNWEVVVQNVTTTEKVAIGQGITILARIYDAFDESVPLLNDGTNVESARYSCFYNSNGLFDPINEPVEGHTNVEAGSSCVLDALHTSYAWTLDDVGYNFALTPNIRNAPLFEREGNYQIKVVVTLSEGNPIVFYAPIAVYER